MPDDDPKEDKRYPAAADEKPSKKDAGKKGNVGKKATEKPVKKKSTKKNG